MNPSDVTPATLRDIARRAGVVEELTDSLVVCTIRWWDPVTDEIRDRDALLRRDLRVVFYVNINLLDRTERLFGRVENRDDVSGNAIPLSRSVEMDAPRRVPFRLGPQPEEKLTPAPAPRDISSRIEEILREKSLLHDEMIETTELPPVTGRWSSGGESFFGPSQPSRTRVRRQKITGSTIHSVLLDEFHFGNGLEKWEYNPRTNRFEVSS